MTTNRRHRLARTLAGSVIPMIAWPAFAQDEEKRLPIGKWHPTLETGVNLTQSAYSDNWAGGDKGSIVWTWILNATAENQVSEGMNSLNMLKLAYGQTHKQSADGTGERNWDRPETSTDLIDFETIWRATLGLALDPFASGRFESQFQDASDAAGRTLALNPLRFKETVGVARRLVDEEHRSLLARLGFSLRQSVRRGFTEPAPAMTTASETTNDGGVEFIADYTSKILENRVSWTSKLSVYRPIFYSGKSDLDGLTKAQLLAAGLDPDIAGFTTTVDVDWENIFSTQITKLVSVNLYTKLVYDKYDNSVKPLIDEAGELTNPGSVKSAVRKSGQFKQTLGIGVTYRVL